MKLDGKLFCMDSLCFRGSSHPPPPLSDLTTAPISFLTIRLTNQPLAFLRASFSKVVVHGHSIMNIFFEAPTQPFSNLFAFQTAEGH
jgi:hypothetical protein